MKKQTLFFSFGSGLILSFRHSHFLSLPVSSFVFAVEKRLKVRGHRSKTQTPTKAAADRHRLPTKIPIIETIYLRTTVKD